MSASVLARSYNETPPAPVQSMLVPSRSVTRTSRPPPGSRGHSGTRISFAADTSFHERSSNSRKSSRSSSSSLNFRLVQGTERPVKVRIRVPKATTATGTRRPTRSDEEYLNPKRAMEIARSYGIPKYFLRNNSQQVLTDGRMRLFGDSIWKKEHATKTDSERPGTTSSSEVINRLMDSVNRAIESSHKKRRPYVNETETEIETGQWDIMSMKTVVGGEEVFTEKSIDGEKMADKKFATISRPNSHVIEQQHIGGYKALDRKINDGVGFHDLRPHTVDTDITGGFRIKNKHLPKMDAIIDSGELMKRVESSENLIPKAAPNSSSSAGIRLKQLAAPFRTISDLTAISEKNKTLEEKYHNVLPRFYPVVSAHHNKQKSDNEKSVTIHKNRKKANQRMNVRFADSNSIRNSIDAEKSRVNNESLTGLVAKRAPVQSVQRALDSHSCLRPIDKNKIKLTKDLDSNLNKSKTLKSKIDDIDNETMDNLFVKEIIIN